MPQFVSDKRIYLNADKSAVVEEGHPDAAFLLAAEGGTVTAEQAKQYGLKAPKAEDDEPDAKAVSKAEVEDKSVKGPKSG